MLSIVLTVILALLCVLGTLLTLFQLPGTWLIVAATAGYAWYHDWTVIGVWTVAAMLAVALLAEAAEMLAGVWFTRKGGGSRRAAWWGLAGGIAGAILLSIPVPIIGTMVGAAIGCFCGAAAAELSLDRTTTHAARLGLLSALGRTVGTMFKIAAALALAGVALASAVMGR